MIPSDYRTAREQKALARRALDDARAAVERLAAVRTRGGTPVHETDAATGPVSREALQARMREIEIRMLATDELMRSAERGIANSIDEHVRDGSDHGVSTTVPPASPDDGATAPRDPAAAPPARRS